ncbi:hypothetical protein QR680_018284 [Steinernema hermaphroditum]|uniref:Uncharacterized protein n=1 Tax=Steinernema hermaphroditum TaxID=289476 RepID=A0AA39LQL3_9BILA|nr:hypothetical protein QR680_018284 [Steinernema hermaphroditum]
MLLAFFLVVFLGFSVGSPVTKSDAEPFECIFDFHVKNGTFLYKCLDGKMADFLGCITEYGDVLTKGASHSRPSNEEVYNNIKYGIITRCEQDAFVPEACLVTFDGKSHWMNAGESIKLNGEEGMCIKVDDQKYVRGILLILKVTVIIPTVSKQAT